MVNLGQAGKAFNLYGNAETEVINAATKAAANLSENFSGGGLRSKIIQGIRQDIFETTTTKEPVTLLELQKRKQELVTLIEKTEQRQKRIDNKRAKLFNQPLDISSYDSILVNKVTKRLHELLKGKHKILRLWNSAIKENFLLEAKIRPLQQLFDAREAEIAKLSKQADEARQLHNFDAFNELEQQIENLRIQNASL